MSITQRENVSAGTEEDIEAVKVQAASPYMNGRESIYTSEERITAENVVRVLNDALPTHQVNRMDIEYLHNYLRGDQPIRDRVKYVREEICNRIVINLANMIVTFKTANFIGEPLQYVSRGAGADVPAKIETLNSLMMSENKASKDMRLAYWMFTAGVGYRLVLRDKAEAYMRDEIYDEAPFEIYTLDPRNTFVIRSNDVTERVLAGVTYVFQDASTVVFTVYTANETFYVKGSLLQADKLERVVAHNFGMVPIIEYPCNSLRMGAFEIVIDLLDAINNIESNRLDGIEQFIQALMVFENVDIDEEQFQQLKEKGGLKVSSKDGRTAKVYYLNEQLDQSQTQTLMDDMIQIVLQIVGMPAQGNANTSDSSNNGAVIMKNGWWHAEARAKETEGMWRESETEFLKAALKICRDTDAVDLRISEIEQKFTRRSYEDLLVKTQSFTTLIGAGVPPIQAFTVSGLVTDPESAAITYDNYQKAKDEALMESLNQNPRESVEVIEAE